MRNALLASHSYHTDLGLLLLRITLGGLFVYYGYNKLMSYSQMEAAFPDLIGIGAKLSLNLVIFAELVCGFLVLVGFLTRLAVIPIFITMVVAFFIAHAKDPFDMKALPFVFMLLCVVLFIMGSGRFSMDRSVFRK